MHAGNTIIRMLSIAVMLCSTAVFSQWVQTSGPVGGGIRGFVTLGNNTILAGSAMADIYKSTDGGATWSIQASKISQWGISKMVLCGTSLYATDANNRVLYSRNGGTSWDTAFKSVNIAFLGVKDTFVYIGDYSSGIRRASSSNDSFVSISFTNGNPTSMTTAGNTIIVSSLTTGISISNDNGATWSVSNTGLPTNSHVLALAGVNDTVYATCDSAIYISVNRGASWGLVGASATLKKYQLRSIVSTGTSKFALVNYSGAIATTILKTDDNFATFSIVNPTNSDMLLYDIAVQGSKILISTERGAVYSSTNNGSTWQLSSAGIKDAHVNSLQNINGTLYAATAGSGLFTSANNGSSWTKLDLSWSTFQDLYKDGNILYFNNNSGVFRTTDNGATWNKACSLSVLGKQQLVAEGNLLIAIAYGAYGNKDYRSKDGGANWTKLDTTLTDASSIAKKGNLLLVGGIGKVYWSIDSGTTFNKVNFGGPYTTPGITAFAFSGNAIIAATNSSGIYRSIDNGNSWTSATLNQGFNWSGILCLATSGSAVFAGTHGGVYRSADNGATWSGPAQGENALSTNTILVKDSTVFIGTYFNSVWKRPAKEMVGNAAVSAVRQMQINQPASPTLQINASTKTVALSLATSSVAKIGIYNLAGREVARVVDYRLSKGQHSFTIDSKGLSTGFYFVRANMGNTSLSERIFITK